MASADSESRGKPKEIIFFGHFGTQNLGNECTLHAIICNTLKRVPDARLKCLCTVPEDTVARHNLPAFGLAAESPASFKALWQSSRLRPATKGFRREMEFRVQRQGDLRM